LGGRFLGEHIARRGGRCLGNQNVMVIVFVLRVGRWWVIPVGFSSDVQFVFRCERAAGRGWSGAYHGG
jgi:hypothetical protein